MKVYIRKFTNNGYLKQELDQLINQISSMDNVQRTYIKFKSELQDLNGQEQEELIQLLIKNYGRNI